jgi:hypothetical protein
MLRRAGAPVFTAAALAAAALAAATLDAAPATASPAGGAACTPGVTTIKGVQARVFCGSAKAVVFANGKRYVFANGTCERHGRYFVVNIGTVVLGGGDKAPLVPYFGLLMGKHPAASAAEPVVAGDGTYSRGLITMVGRGLEAATLHGAHHLQITLRNDRHAGSFSGVRPGIRIIKMPPLRLRGTFTC